MVPGGIQREVPEGGPEASSSPRRAVLRAPSHGQLSDVL